MRQAQGEENRRLGLRAGMLALLSLCLCALAAGAAVVAGAAGAGSAGPTVQFSPREAPQIPLLFLFSHNGLPDPVEQLLDQAEQDMRAGEEYYEAGHLDHARQQFDAAVDLFLTSRFRLQDDARLRFTFDRLVDRIYQLDRESLQETAAAGEPTDVPTPLEEIEATAPLTFPLDPQLRAQVEQELNALAHDLPLTVNDRVLAMVNFFGTPRGRKIIQTGLERAGRYRALITGILEREGLPRDLLYVAQAESAFQTNARSRSRAVGLWQFLSWRAREYGLEVNWWVDERRDPVKSTLAAAHHLKDLYEQFGDWYLALAAYNSGPNRVARALERAGGQADYWTLVDQRLLPRETRNYVPIILAVALVAKTPARYGVEVDPDPPLQYDVVKVSKPIDLRRVAEVLGVDVDVLRALNPQLLRSVTPPHTEDFELYVPRGTADTLLAQLPNIPESKRVLWQQHRVQRGETLSYLASRFGTSSYAIAQANGISVRSLIRVGQVLVIPTGGGAGDYAEPPRAERTRAGTLVYTVRSGDTLSTIAGRHGVSLTALVEANGLSLRSVIRPGDRLVVPERGGSGRRQPTRTSSRGERSGGSYTVERGDTLSVIASRHGVSLTALAAANGLSLRSVIRPGQRLRIPGEGESTQVRANTHPRVHRVHRGETLWDLSQRYQVSVTDLREANPYLEERSLQAGDRLTIPE